MIFPKQETWDEWEIKEELHKFFFLRWQEIFDETTFDSWQIRSCNLTSILDELLIAIDVVDRVQSSHQNIQYLIDEAKLIAKDDLFIKEHFSFVGGYLKKLKHEYDSCVKNENKSNDNFRKLVKVILGNLVGYRKRLENSLLTLIITPPEKNYKSKIYALTMAFGVEIKAQGYSTDVLKESYKILTKKELGSFVERFKKLKDDFSGTENKYNCHFFISWPGKLPNFSENNITFIKKHPDLKPGTLSDEEHEFYKQNSEALIAKITVKSLDHYSARMKAERILDSLFAVNTLYTPTKKAVVKHKKTLISSEKDGCKYCITEQHSLKYIRDAKNAERNIEELWEVSKRLPVEESAQLSASLQYHKSALLSLTDQAKLVNLWIAIESLVQKGGTNIIDRITKYIPASVSTGYIYLLTKSIPIDISSFWKKIDNKKFRSKLTKSNKYILHPYDLLQILLDKEDGELISGFLNLISDNPLLVFRIGNLWKGPFSSPKELRKRLERHNNNILWQLRRIYRLRNYVMHNGIIPRQTRQLIHHLHSYYILTIHNLIHDLKVNTNWGISEALEHRYQLYEQLTYKLTKKKIVDTQGLFRTSSILFRNPKTSAWENRES
ncbi:MAG: hypothetical protein GY730_07230 [bacterium]|nr:hypothetical protein [bacterium]